MSPPTSEPGATLPAGHWEAVDRLAHTVLSSAGDGRLTSYATGTRFIDVYGHPIEGDKRFRADIADALNQITALADDLAKALGASTASPESGSAQAPDEPQSKPTGAA